jgi:hypothetical protein
MDGKELVTTQSGIPLADSREIAEQLGIEHGPFMTNIILKYRDEIEEDFGPIHFQNGVKTGPQRGKLPQYALLTEDQTYTYMSYSKNTPQARACKRLLVKAFADARKLLQAGEPSPILFSHKHMQRIILSAQKTVLPPDTWCVFFEMERFLNREEIRGVRLLESATPDVSVGIRWCQYLKEQGYDMALIQKYKHHYPDGRGIKEANAYPNAWLGVFASWFHNIYVQEHYPGYVKSHTYREAPDRIA